jgi:MFS family permease
VPFLYRSDESRLGLVMMAMTATMAAWSPLGGRIAEKVGVQRVVLAGGVAGAAGIVAIMQVGMSGSLAGLAAGLLLVGVGLGLSSGPAQASALSAVDQRQSAMAAALMSMLRYGGGIAGTGILSVALAGGASDPARHRAALWTYALAFVSSALLARALPSGNR